jgi:HAD superfamily hydrolase (TIGR01450 family)
VPQSGVVVVDLDGVVWRSEVPIDGAAEAVSSLRGADFRVAFFTNNSYVSNAEVREKLARQGVSAEEDDVLSSAQAAAGLLAAGDRALVVGGRGSLEALADAGVEAVPCDGKGDGAGFDAVVVGLDPDFDYSRLTQAMAAVLNGARLIGTNSDATWPTSQGELPGGGAVLAAVATASSVKPVIAGKPHEPAAALVRQRLGSVTLVVGDRPSTDGAFARRIGARFGLVLTGVTPSGHGTLDPAPDLEAGDLAALARRWLAAKKAAN